MQSLFHSLVRVFHDGIIISHNEDIIFKNKQVNKTFNLKPQLIERQADEEQRSRETSAASALENQDNLMDILKSLQPDNSSFEESEVFRLDESHFSE